MNRRIFRHSKSLRIAMCYLVICLFLILLSIRIYRLFTSVDSSVASISERQKKLITSFNEKVRKDSIARDEKFRHYDRQGQVLFAFDPNTADSVELVQLGLRAWQVHNMLKYRRAGGRWKNADDFSRLYGLKEADFLRLKPYIRIEPTKREIEREHRQHMHDSIARKRIEKYAEGTVIDLNDADTNMLKHIPGVGSYYAYKICKYRERLGGFVSAHQISEIEGLPKEMERWFFVKKESKIRKINVNKADFKELVRHPYLSYEQVKVIFSYRNKYGELKGWQDLELDEHFPAKIVLKLEPYFSFR